MRKLLMIFCILGIKEMTFAQWTSGSGTTYTTDNVGVGAMPSGSYKLFVNGSTSSQMAADGDNMADFLNTHSGSYTYGAGGVVIRSSYITGPANFGTGSGALIVRNGSSTYTANINYNGSGYFAGPFLIGTTTDDGINKLQVFGGGTFTGNVGIGTNTPAEKLSVSGKIRAKEIKVETSGWPDYVFELSYNLPALHETEQFIKVNKHLPGIPSAKEAEKEGINLGEMNTKLLQKIEELTLHLISQDKKLTEQNERIKLLEKGRFRRSKTL